MKINVPREKRSIEVWNVCECGEVLHNMAEGERGTCSSCWVRSLRPEQHKAMKRLIASAFNGSSDAEKGKAVDDAMREFAP